MGEGSLAGSVVTADPRNGRRRGKRQNAAKMPLAFARNGEQARDRAAVRNGARSGCMGDLAMGC